MNIGRPEVTVQENYIHDEFPPVVRRTATDHFQLEGQSGVVVAEYNQENFALPGSFWSDLIDAMAGEYDNLEDGLHDLTLLMIHESWEYVDDR